MAIICASHSCQLESTTENLDCTVGWTASTEDWKENSWEKWDCSCMMDCMSGNLGCTEDSSVNTESESIKSLNEVRELTVGFDGVY